MEDQHLAITLGPGADPDGWRFHFGRDHGRDFSRNAFEIDARHAGTVESHRVAHQPLDGRKVLALHLVTAHHIHGLRGQPDVASDRNFGVDDVADEIGTLLSTFDLHGLGACFFHVPSRVAYSFVHAHVVGAVWHVDREQRVLHGAPYSAGVVQHLV